MASAEALSAPLITRDQKLAATVGHHATKGEAAMWIVALILAAFTGTTLLSLLQVIWDAR